MRQLPVSARLYVSGIVLLATVLAIVAVRHIEPSQWLSVFVLSCLVIASETASLSLLRPGLVSTPISISTTMPVVLASYLIVGPWGAALTGLAMLADPTPLSLVKRTFNGAQLSLAGLAAGQTYLWLGGDLPLTRDSFPRAILLVLVANLVFELVNMACVLGVVSLSEGVAPQRIWTGMMSQIALPAFVYSIFGLLLAVVWTS
ncbi:MAG TPA: hypothetical protein VIC82_00280, partial [Candidatus Nanopelagicales bacterium]